MLVVQLAPHHDLEASDLLDLPAQVVLALGRLILDRVAPVVHLLHRLLQLLGTHTHTHMSDCINTHNSYAQARGMWEQGARLHGAPEAPILCLERVDPGLQLQDRGLAAVHLGLHTAIRVRVRVAVHLSLHTAAAAAAAARG